jgi:hypothetical protein
MNRSRTLIACVVVAVISITATAGAASHYLITSTKQIKPSVRKELKGARGPKGTTGATGQAGPQGPAGVQGAQGAQGPAGPVGTSALNFVAGSGTIAAGDIDGGSMECPAGQRIVSGGYTISSGYAFIDAPTPDHSGWDVAIDNSGSSVAGTLTIVATCAGSGQAVAASRRAPKLSRLPALHQKLVDERR